ncbi:MAG: YtxH domain-containing protein [Vampirovibrio sp.]|nr:YtxH domain-containing protein [Vampirovibrio sp.]
MAKEGGASGDDGIFAFLLGMVFGILGGGIAALLYAPKPGEDTREELKIYAKALPGKVNEDIRHGKTREFFDRTLYNLENKVDQVSKSRKAGKTAKAKRREEMASGYDQN